MESHAKKVDLYEPETAYDLALKMYLALKDKQIDHLCLYAAPASEEGTSSQGGFRDA